MKELEAVNDSNITLRSEGRGKLMNEDVQHTQ